MTDRKPIVLGGAQQQQIQPGDTLELQASVAGGASLNMPHGIAPTSPIDGDTWTTSAGLFIRVNGTTIGPLATSEWAPNFTSAGDVYIPAPVAMTIDQGNAAIGTGTITFAKSTTATPGTFTATTLPATLQAGAWLKVSAASVTGFVATHLKRTA